MSDQKTEIFVDWGSSNFRAFLMQDGKVCARRDAPDAGVLKPAKNADDKSRFANFLHAQIADWLDKYPQASIILCGAIGSREGWIDTGYVAVPAGLEDFATALNAVPPEYLHDLTGRDVSILPGLTISHGDRHDVIRSEEIKALGAISLLGQSNGLLCIPGTHCKWLEIKNSQITDFHTVLTGEFFNLISESGSFARLFNPGEEINMASFDQGVALSRKGANILSDIWQVRAQKIRNPNPPGDMRGFLSGILIGHEIRQMSKTFPAYHNIILLSDPGQRQDCYKRALETCGWTITAVVESATAVCTGLKNLRRLT